MKTYPSICTACNISSVMVRGDNVCFSSKDVLPTGLCFMAFHAVFPYVSTLANGGWFNWVNYKEHVIAKCPAPKCISLFVKGFKRGSPQVIRCEVMTEAGPCFLGHEPGNEFSFDVDPESMWKLNLLFSLYPHLLNLGEFPNEKKLLYSLPENNTVVECEVEYYAYGGRSKAAND